MRGYTMRTINSETVKDWVGKNGIKFDVRYSRAGVARIFIGDAKTPYYANGGGYCKESSVIASMINDVFGALPYDDSIYGSRNGKLSGGVGFRSIQECFNSIEGQTLTKIYSSSVNDVYEIKLSKK